MSFVRITERQMTDVPSGVLESSDNESRFGSGFPGNSLRKTCGRYCQEFRGHDGGLSPSSPDHDQTRSKHEMPSLPGLSGSESRDGGLKKRSKGTTTPSASCGWWKRLKGQSDARRFDGSCSLINRVFHLIHHPCKTDGVLRIVEAKHV